jgi:hypothetical protein
MRQTLRERTDVPTRSPGFWDHIDTMAAKAVRMHGRRTCAVEVSPVEVDAGVEFTVTVRASCPDGCDLTGQSVSIRDQGDTEAARAELAQLDGESTAAFVLRAPLEVGEHVWRAVLAAHDKEGISHEATSTTFSFATRAHAASVNVWGMPSAIPAGERFSFMVGIKCSTGCKLAGRPLFILDRQGAQVGAASLGDDIWPGTSALYFAEVEAQAPLATGDHRWQIETAGSDAGVPHAAGSVAFAIRVVGPPDHEVTVEAFDREKQAPIKGAHVLLHPYRALTDVRGTAKIKVAKGRYRLFVSGFNYIAYQDIIEVAGDVTMRAELTAEPEGLEDYR